MATRIRSENEMLKNKERSARYYAANKDRVIRGTRAARWRRLYGITPEEYDRMNLEQDGKCAICGNPEDSFQNGKRDRLSVDHNHSTGKVRKLLCHRCNTAIGLVAENTETLRSMISYIENHEKVEEVYGV